MNDIVYVVREGEDNEALRYSLRSLANFPHGSVFISGYTPSWVQGVISLNRKQGVHTDLENTNLNLIGALKQPDLSEDFILMMDDVFFMYPTEEVPICYNGTLDHRIETYKTDNRFNQAYSLMKTRDWLKAQGCDDLMNYEMHFPCLFNKHDLFSMYENAINDIPLIAIRPRTMYYNLYKLNGQEVDDAKESRNKKAQFISVGRDFSTSETGRYIRSIFTDRSPYES